MARKSIADTDEAVTNFAAAERRQAQARAAQARPRGRSGENPRTGNAVATMASGNRNRGSLCATSAWITMKGTVTQVTTWRGLRTHMANIATMRTMQIGRKMFAGTMYR